MRVSQRPHALSPLNTSLCYFLRTRAFLVLPQYIVIKSRKLTLVQYCHLQCTFRFHRGHGNVLSEVFIVEMYHPLAQSWSNPSPPPCPKHCRLFASASSYPRLHHQLCFPHSCLPAALPFSCSVLLTWYKTRMYWRKAHAHAPDALQGEEHSPAVLADRCLILIRSLRRKHSFSSSLRPPALPPPLSLPANDLASYLTEQ